MASVEYGYVGNTRYIFTNEGGVSSLMGGQQIQAGLPRGGNQFTAGISLSGNSSVGGGIAYGNGGNGAYSSSSNTTYSPQNYTGGNGAPGIVIVEEFY